MGPWKERSMEDHGKEGEHNICIASLRPCPVTDGTHFTGVALCQKMTLKNSNKITPQHYMASSAVHLCHFPTFACFSGADM